ncbi:MBL fold metallo-hydrolase [Polymorphobacter fuscus]|uniref:MBL fold metallo-hydrolase n=1 Tax=Sandarakinorhabdus fusca TaxID=1439888 RepID=A0A7C9GQ87_9SPHN|nr:MBL fold metallo-hydrolase [Polymorphobacter fuscus]KAB7646149.1 MBL fold metallo-hydrolase [Polymorphobacter fuscus]MQT17350.1 MBL fold metallo-hydrolase [Polymorphobacter fuscus]NJC10116.1 ribonuclease Z [Polymorphobacter fuscus]
MGKAGWRTIGAVMIGVMAIIAAAGLGVWLFQPQLGTLLLTRVAQERAGRDATAGLPDGLHVILCGTGSPLPDPTRAGPCTMIIAGRHIYVVDAGEGAARNLLLMGLPTGRIDRLFLTHFHSDHIDGMGPMLLMRWSARPNLSPLPVAGPTGVEAVVAGFNQAYARDNGYRTAHHGAAIMPPGGAGGVAMPFAFGAAPVVVLDDQDVRVTAFPVDHGPVSPAVGYRFDYKGRSVVISGDTAPSPSVAAAARGADLLVHEALQPALVARLTDALVARGVANTAQVTRDILNYHSSPEQAADAARTAGARQLVLNHVVPPMPFRFAYPAFLGDAARRFDGPITVGEDGMIFTLPANGTATTAGRLM